MKVLLVEDDFDVARNVCEYLSLSRRARLCNDCGKELLRLLGQSRKVKGTRDFLEAAHTFFN